MCAAPYLFLRFGSLTKANFHTYIAEIMRYCDIAIVGAGTAGRSFLATFSTMLLATSKQATVCYVQNAMEDHGGTCMNKGCLGKSMLFYAANERWKDRLNKYMGLEGQVESVNYELLSSKVRKTTKDNNKAAIGEDVGILYETTSSELLYGNPRFVSPTAFTLRGREYTFSYLVLATGATARVEPRILADVDIQKVSSDRVFEWDTLPASLAIVGGGYVAVEFASIFAALGSKVDMYVRSQVMRRLGASASSKMEERLRIIGVNIVRCSPRVSESWTHRGYWVGCAGRNEKFYDKTIVAVGRVGNLPDGWENLNIEADGDGIVTKPCETYDRCEYLTTNEGVIAVGDVVSGTIRLTTTASTSSRIAAKMLFERMFKVHPLVEPPKVTAQLSTPPQSTIFMASGVTSFYGQRTAECYNLTVMPNKFKFLPEDDATVPFLDYCVNTAGNVSSILLIGEGAPGAVSWFTLNIIRRGGSFSLDEFSNYQFMYPTTLSAVISTIRRGTTEGPCCTI
jgi:glutathione reductase (NADPH)